MKEQSLSIRRDQKPPPIDDEPKVSWEGGFRLEERRVERLSSRQVVLVAILCATAIVLFNSALDALRLPEKDPMEMATAIAILLDATKVVFGTIVLYWMYKIRYKRS